MIDTILVNKFNWNLLSVIVWCTRKIKAWAQKNAYFSGYTKKLLFTDASTIKELDLNTGNVTLVVNTASVVYSMAYDYENKYLYVPRSTQNDIMR